MSRLILGYRIVNSAEEPDGILYSAARLLDLHCQIDLITLWVLLDKAKHVTIEKIILSPYNCNLSATQGTLATGKAKKLSKWLKAS